MSEIIERLTDLHKQATEERSHYYVGKCVCDAIATIAELERRIAAFEAHHEEKDALIIGLSRDAQCNAEDARAERQRREECEKVARALAYNLRDSELFEYKQWLAYVARYSSESPSLHHRGRE